MEPPPAWESASIPFARACPTPAKESAAFWEGPRDPRRAGPRHSHASLELGEQLRCQGVPSAGVSHDVCEFGESEPLCNPPLPNGPRVSLSTPTIRGKLGEARKISVITPITNTGSRGICDGTQMISNPNSLVRLEKQATKFRVVANAGEIEREGQGVPDGT